MNPIKRGKELKAAYRLLDEVPKLPQNSQPIIKVYENYSKRRQDQAEVEFFTICTDMTVDVTEIREAAHYRRQIENNVFKRRGEHCGAKNSDKSCHSLSELDAPLMSWVGCLWSSDSSVEEKKQ